jgi:MFS family permease
MKAASVYPPGALNVNGFSFFNAVSFQIVLGAPVILFAKSLGASSFVLGTIAALTPLLNILQLLAARFLHRVGYKRFVLAGWGARTFFTFCIAVLPLLPGLSIPTRLGLLIAALFCFNLLRGVSAGAWLPWLTALVPAPVRGRFLSRDNAFMHLGCLAALLLSAWVMTGSVEADEYAAVFGIGLFSALISLLFVRRIPEAESAEDRKQSGVPVPWGAMLRYPPFAKLLWFTTIYMTVIGSLGVFTVEYLVVRGKFAESMILLLSAWSFVGALAGLAITAPRLDATGSKPWLRHGLVIMALVILGWFFLASGLLPGWPALVAALNFFGGLAGAIFGVANTRITMGSVPAMGRNHFFALFTVVSGIGLGGAPMVWGAMLDTLGTLDVVLGVMTVNRYSVYFAVLVVFALLALRLIPGLHEGAAIETAPPTAADARPVTPVE